MVLLWVDQNEREIPKVEPCPGVWDWKALCGMPVWETSWPFKEVIGQSIPAPRKCKFGGMNFELRPQQKQSYRIWILCQITQFTPRHNPPKRRVSRGCRLPNVMHREWGCQLLTLRGWTCEHWLLVPAEVLTAWDLGVCVGGMVSNEESWGLGWRLGAQSRTTDLMSVREVHIQLLQTWQRQAVMFAWCPAGRLAVF